MRLEYRLLDEANEFPVLYYYDGMGQEEIAMRFACDYFVKDGTVFEKTSNAVEVGTYVIYVQKPGQYVFTVTEKKPLPFGGGISVEMREEQDGDSNYPVIFTFKFRDNMEALLHFQSDYLYIMDKEWLKTRVQIDEDRKVYIIFVKQP